MCSFWEREREKELAGLHCGGNPGYGVRINGREFSRSFSDSNVLCRIRDCTTYDTSA